MNSYCNLTNANEIAEIIKPDLVFDSINNLNIAKKIKFNLFYKSAQFSIKIWSRLLSINFAITTYYMYDTVFTNKYWISY